MAAVGGGGLPGAGGGDELGDGQGGEGGVGVGVVASGVGPAAFDEEADLLFVEEAAFGGGLTVR
ncbi:MAG: hypothetical protein R2749_13325 [Acidimicrobiales bacterium]